MNGKELLNRGLRLGIPLWRIEDELDWRENQGPCGAEDDGASSAGLSSTARRNQPGR